MNIETLTANMLNQLIERIEIGQPLRWTDAVNRKSPLFTVSSERQTKFETGIKVRITTVQSPFAVAGYIYKSSRDGVLPYRYRYYDPEIGRFINADGYISAGQGVVSNNMFAYCLNNPINMTDPTGALPKWLKEVGARLKYLGKFVFGVVTAPLNQLRLNWEWV